LNKTEKAARLMEVYDNPFLPHCDATISDDRIERDRVELVLPIILPWLAEWVSDVNWGTSLVGPRWKSRKPVFSTRGYGDEIGILCSRLRRRAIETESDCELASERLEDLGESFLITQDTAERSHSHRPRCDMRGRERTLQRACR